MARHAISRSSQASSRSRSSGGSPGTGITVGISGGTAAAGRAAAAAGAPMDILARVLQPNITLFARRWLIIFSGSLALFVIRFLVPSPVGMADNGDGPKLMCGLAVAPVTGGHARYDSYAYFTFESSASCGSFRGYSTSQHLLLVLAKWLTPLLGLSGTVSLVALGLVTCALQSAGVASLVCGLRLGLRNTLLVAAALWLVLADAAFFDAAASPLEDSAALTGLLLVAAGVLYLGRGPLALAFGLLLGGAGGYLAIVSKEQYVLLTIPICVTLILASPARSSRGLTRFVTARTAAAGAVSGLLVLAAAGFVHHDATTPFGTALHHQQAVDVIFERIVNGDHNAASDLRALGLPPGWAAYAGSNFWSARTVYHDPLYPRYVGELTDGNLVHFLFTHPAKLITIGQLAANDALALRVSYLGSYAPSAGHPAGALENRVTVLGTVMQAIPDGLGLLWLVPLWAAMAAVAAWSLRGRRLAPWHRDAALALMLLVACAVAAFVPPAYFAGVETTRHMLGSNMATALAFLLSAVLVSSRVSRRIDGGGVARGRRGQRGRAVLLTMPAEEAAQQRGGASNSYSGPVTTRRRRRSQYLDRLLSISRNRANADRGTYPQERGSGIPAPSTSCRTSCQNSRTLALTGSVSWPSTL